MKNRYWLGCVFVFILLTISVFGQQTIVINDPTITATPISASAAEENLIKTKVLPKARELWSDNDVCTEEFQIAGVAKGAFTKANARQTLIFYQFCQVGNGFGHNGLVLIENGRVAANYVSEGSWALDIKALPDINQNGLNEFAVYYSGGMHQGQGGSGVDILEFSGGGAIKGLGWFQADMYGEVNGDYGYKVTVKPGKVPLFYREKYMASANNRWRKSGKLAAFKLDKAFSKFDVLK